MATNLNALLGVRHCKKCGKEFCASPMHKYRVNHKWYCSWTCFDHRNDKKSKKPPRVRQVEQLTLEGKHLTTFRSVNNASEYTGYTPTYIRSACEKQTPFKGFLWRYVEK